MKNVLEACVPRNSIVQGTFNPEVFTAAIRPVVEYYKSGTSSIDELYTDAIRFFRDATYPTEGLKQTVSSVFRRISGDNTAPSIYRAETGFGGGKTHMLIACTHIAARGTELREVTKDILDSQYLPDPGSVVIVGVAGDEISVTRTKGERLVPHTLWGEIAYQVGGEDLYRQVREQAEAPAAPGEAFLAKVLGGKTKREAQSIPMRRNIKRELTMRLCLSHLKMRRKQQRVVTNILIYPYHNPLVWFLNLPKTKN